MIITIDGPAGAGKSTIAALVARARACDYLNSGLLYRALAYILVKYKNYTQVGLESLTREAIDEIFKNHKFVYSYCAENGARVSFDGIDITPSLKTHEIDKASSLISQNPFIRNAIFDYQRDYAKESCVVIDGRDTGSTVFPYAEFKFFLTASLCVRAKRFCENQKGDVKKLSLDECINALADRDDRDINRPLSPLVVPHGAIIVDSSDLSIKQVLELILSYIN